MTSTLICPALTITNGTIDFDSKQKYLRLDLMPGLFLNFAEVNAEATVLTFAKKYGQLRNDASRKESVSNWLYEAKLMAKEVNATNSFRSGTSSNNDSRTIINGYLLDVHAEVADEGRLAFVPNCLLAAMWMQFARWWSGEITLKRCVHCQEWFRKTHLEKKFCSVKCRNAAYLANKDEAGKMAVKGKTPREIAAIMGKDVGLIKKWIKESQ